MLQSNPKFSVKQPNHTLLKLNFLLKTHNFDNNVIFLTEIEEIHVITIEFPEWGWCSEKIRKWLLSSVKTSGNTQ